MNDGPFTDEEIKKLRTLLDEERARKEMHIMIRTTMKAWAFWITIVAAIVGGTKSWLDQFWIKHP